VLICSMVLVFCFAVSGVIVAGDDPKLVRHIWFPLMLTGLSGFLVIKVYVRLNIRSNNE
jgi:hypothetical protein